MAQPVEERVGETTDPSSTAPPAPTGDGKGPATVALGRAVQHLRDRQDEGGWWRGLLETNVTMDAEDLMMRQFLGIRTSEETEESARWIRDQQRADGSWSNFAGGPADPSTTTEAYVALRLAGDDPREEHMRRARDSVLEHGGLEGTRVFTRIWLALFGQWDWKDVPALPPEMIYLPTWFPFNIYDFACWARQTIAPLALLCALRPSRDLGVDVGELRAGRRPRSRPTRPLGRAFEVLDRGLHLYERAPVPPLRRSALRRMTGWIVERQEADGCWGGIQPPWVYSLMALHAAGMPLDHPVLAAGVRGWERFTVRDETESGPRRWIEACQSPVWDTVLALVALGDAGVPGDDPQVTRAVDWVLENEITVPGDWSVRRPATPAGGCWAFEFDNDGYPDIDDTAVVVMALRRAATTPRTEEAISRAVRWLQAMQSSNGGWGGFDVDNTREVAYALPFCDFGAVIDPPSADVTAHVVEALAGEAQADPDVVRRGVAWLRRAQEPDGSWFGRWGANHVYGTGAVVPALVAAGIATSDPSVRAAVEWLERVQNDDGGWGEDLRSYDDPSWIGRGESTPSQTAWALLALHAAGRQDSPVALHGIDWLVRMQHADGQWDESLFTGTGFPGDFYIKYHLYRQVFPISALGRCLARGR